METTGSEIILHDLLAWEPRLAVASPSPSTVGTSHLLAREVDWVVTARATVPMLPTVRGGELIILPQRVVQETGIPFPRLISEMLGYPIAGILTESPAPEVPVEEIAVLTLPRIDPETESDLNRLLAARRRELLDLTARIDRTLGDALNRGDRVADVITGLSGMLGIPIRLLSPDAEPLLSGRQAPGWMSASLAGGRTLRLGPIPLTLHARARFALDRIREGVQRLIDREAAPERRGRGQGSALRSLLLPETSTTTESRANAAYQAGIAPGRILHVALVPAETGSHRLRRILAPLGAMHRAGIVDGLTAIVTVAPASGPRPVIQESVQDEGWIAISGAAGSGHDLAEATRQARYVARLLEQEALAGPVASFDDATMLGVYRLLYPQWGTPALARYQESLLGGLQREDRHGSLIETLRVYLEEGGSLRPAAERLGIHRNTLAYRLRRIRLLIGRDLDTPQARLGLQIALVAASLPDAPE